jgi:hypothetical protein
MNEEGREKKEIKNYFSAIFMEANEDRLPVHFLIPRKPLPLSLP